MASSELLRQLETTVRALRIAVTVDDFDAATNLSDTLHQQLKSVWQECPAHREALLRNALEGVRGSLFLTVERREAIRHQVDLMDACQDANANSATRRIPLSVSF
jgi:DNA-binding GntR family transcriptional regulator